jgi:hypothetical protein
VRYDRSTFYKEDAVSDFIFDISKGAFAEKARDGSTAFGVVLLKVVEADATLRTRATLAAVLAAANTEADFTNYARKTGITGTLTVDTTNHRVDLSIPDQTWTSAGGATNNSLVKFILYYQESASDAGRVPIGAFDFVKTTNGSNLDAVKQDSQVARAA